MDQRIENTYTNLQKSMRELLSDSSWDKINVQMLCDKADVSRSTFYAHFKNKDDLLDSLLSQFEQAMGVENNERSVQVDGKFRFLPMLLNHVRQNRVLFASNNTTDGGYPVAVRFRHLITRLVESELEEAIDSDRLNAATTQYISGGIYSALVHWSGRQENTLHLKLLNDMDELNNCILSKLAL